MAPNQPCRSPRRSTAQTPSPPIVAWRLRLAPNQPCRSPRRSTAQAPGLACLCILTLVLGACASPRITLPQGSGTPLADYEDLFAAAVEPCRRVRTLELLLAISGRSGDARLRGRVRGALARPGSLRLEGLAPFGAPAFVLVAGAAPPVLLLPRERRVVTGASGRDLLAALAGLPLGPADFRAVLTGCLVPHPRAVAARTYGGGWTGVALEGEATLYLREVGAAPVVAAGRRPGLLVEYAGHVRGLPRRIRVQTAAPGAAATDLTATLSQVDINVELDERAFVQEVPGGFVPMPLEALRGAPGPLEEPRPPEAAGLPPRRRPAP